MRGEHSWDIADPARPSVCQHIEKHPTGFIDWYLSARKRARVPGSKYPGTSVAAWSLFMNMLQTDDPKAGELFRSSLAWLLACDPTSLGAYQQRIRQMLSEMFTQT